MPPPRYTSLRTKTELAAANRGFLDALKADANKRAKQTIGTPGGSSLLDTWYAPETDLWVAPDILHNRTWNALGNGDPFSFAKVAPTLEINFPLVHGSSTTAGCALRDDHGVTCFAHTGGVAGGKKGVGKSAFLTYHPLTERVLVDGKAKDLYLLGDLSAPDALAANVSDFARAVADFKAGVDSGQRTPAEDPSFQPEFEGTTEYEVSGTTRVATYTHGRVVNRLYQELKRRRVVAHRTRAVDLFSRPSVTQRGVIFEVKTSTDTQALYTCVGQLVLNAPDDEWKKVAVVPAPVPGSVHARLTAVGVTVLPYDPGPRPLFPTIDALLSSLRAEPLRRGQ